MSLGYEKVIEALRLANKQQLDETTLASVRQYLRELDDRDEILKSWLQPGNTNPYFRDVTIRSRLFLANPAVPVQGGGLASIGVKIQRSDSQIFSNAGAGAYTSFDTVIYDDFNFVNLTSNATRITIPPTGDGKYEIGFNFVWNANSTGYRIAAIKKNGTATVLLADARNAVSSGSTYHGNATEVPLAAGDYIELWGYQNSGGDLGTTPDGDYHLAMWARRTR